MQAVKMDIFFVGPHFFELAWLACPNARYALVFMNAQLYTFVFQFLDGDFWLLADYMFGFCSLESASNSLNEWVTVEHLFLIEVLGWFHENGLWWN